MSDDEALFEYLMANNNHLRSYRPMRDEEPEEGLVASVDPVKDSEKFSGVPTGAPEEGLVADNSHFRTIGKKKKHKWTDAEMAEIRKSCEDTIVHDYSENDFFHISDEEREQMDALAEIRPQMSSLMSIYRRIDSFIEGMRIVMKAIRILEKKFNVLYSENDFYQMLAEGKVQPVGFTIPKLRAKNNKYDPGVIARYIEDETLDPESLLTERELMKKKGLTFADSQLSMETKDEYDDKTARLFTPEERAKLDELSQNPPTMEVTAIEPKFISGYSSTRSYFGKDQKPKFKNRGKKILAEAIHDMLNVIESSPGFNPDPNADVYTRSYGGSANILLGGSFEPVEKEPDPVETFRYTGSLRDKDAFELYKIQLDNEILDSTYDSNSYQTHQSVENKKLFDQMEKAGINVVELRRAMNVPGVFGGISSDQDDYFMKKRALESNMKLEADICTRIIGMNDEPKFLKIVNKAEEMAAAEEKGLLEQ